MKSPALEIIDEFLRSTNTQERCNASTALAIAGTPESLGRLIRTAMSDMDARVRARAEEEIGRLRDAPAEETSQQLADALRRGESETAAYTLLARVSATRHPLVHPSRTGSWLTRLRRVVRFMAASPFRVKSRLGLAWVGLFGVLTMGVVMVSYLALVTGLLLAAPESMAILGLSLVATVVLIFSALARSVSTAAHFDRGAAIVVELVATAVAYGGLGLAVYGLVALAETWPADAAWHVLTLTGVVILAGVATRLGVFLASGIYGRPYNFCLQAFVGAACGLMVATFALLPLWRDWVAAFSFLPLVLVSAGFAFAASWIDAVPPLNPTFPRRVGIASIAVAAAVLVVAGSWVVTRWIWTPTPATGRQPVSVKAAEPGARVQELLAFGAVPQHVRFEIKFPQWVDLSMQSSMGRDLAMRLDDIGRNRQRVGYHDDPDPPRIREFLQPGMYDVVVGGYAEIDGPPSSDSASAAALEGSGVLSALVSGSAGFKMFVTLNADRANPSRE